MACKKSLPKDFIGLETGQFLYHNTKDAVLNISFFNGAAETPIS